MTDNKHKKIRTIFVGTPLFSVPGLVSLACDNDFEVLAVICGKDKKVGRKQVLNEPPVKVAAKEYNLEIMQPEKIKDIVHEIKQLVPDLIVVIAYGQIISKEILDLPKYGCINVHGSLLPKYRGASCIQGAIMNMDPETGITIMKMDERMDTGPIIYQEKIKIENTDTTDTLYEKLSQLSGHVLPKAIKEYIDGSLPPVAQDDSQAIYVKMTQKEDGHINWNKSAKEVSAQIRAMSSWPGAFSNIGDMTLKFIEVGNIENIETNSVATIFENSNKLFVQCKGDSLQIIKIQPAGKKVLSAQDFMRGYSHFLGKKLE